MTGQDAPQLPWEVRAGLLQIRRSVEEAGAMLRALIDQGLVPVTPYMDLWHGIEEAGEAMLDAEPPGWSPPESLGNLPALPPERKRRGIYR